MFENIIGHEKQKKFLIEAFQNGNISHAYLFSGKDGIGKLKIAKEFAKEILRVENLESCPDFKCITKREDKKDIVIEQIRREIIDDVYISPIGNEKKVYIIDNADLLNIASQNSLLKTLEEPPKYVVIILVSSNTSAFLPTILSRVTEINFNGIAENELDNYIKQKYQINLSKNILEFVNGSIGNAIHIIEDKMVDEFMKVDQLNEYLEKKDVINSLKFSEEINFNMSYMLHYLEYILYKQHKFSVIKYVENSKIRLKFNGNYDIIIDNMILRIIDNI